MNIPYIFYKLKKLQIKQIKDKVSLATRKYKTNGNTLQQVKSRPQVSLLMLLCMMKDSGFSENLEVHRRTGRAQKKIFLQ